MKPQDIDAATSCTYDIIFVVIIMMHHARHPAEHTQVVFNSIAFGKSTSQRIYPEQHAPKQG